MATNETPLAGAFAMLAARDGWCVFPMKTGEKRRPPKRWPDLATDDPATVAEWWTDSNPPGWGVHLGRSGLLVVDVDGEAGRDSLTAAERDYGPLPLGICVKTPNGEHRYFHDPGRIPRRLDWRPGLDILTGTHYTIGPGSIMETGAYRLHEAESLDPSGVAELPELWAAALIRVDSESLHTIAPIPPIPNGFDGVSDCDGVSGVQEIFGRYPLTTRGTSHRLIFTLARHLRRFFPDATRPPAVVLDALRRWWEAGKDNTMRTWADTLADFTDAWARIRFDRGALADAMRIAQTGACPVVVVRTLPDAPDAPARLLAALMAELDRRSNAPRSTRACNPQPASSQSQKWIDSLG